MLYQYPEIALRPDLDRLEYGVKAQSVAGLAVTGLKILGVEASAIVGAGGSLELAATEGHRVFTWTPNGGTAGVPIDMDEQIDGSILLIPGGSADTGLVVQLDLANLPAASNTFNGFSTSWRLVTDRSFEGACWSELLQEIAVRFTNSLDVTDKAALDVLVVEVTA